MMKLSPDYNKEDLQDHYAIAAIIKDKEKRVLMQKHNKYGFWTIPVGKIEPNQKIEDGLKQELLEECNILIEKFKQIGQREDIYERNNREVLVKLKLYEIIEYSGEPKNNEPHKHEIQEFKTIEEIKNLKHLSDSTLCYLETLGCTREATIG